MQKIFLIILLLSSLFGMLGCREANKIVVKKPVEIFKTKPKKLNDTTLEVLGHLNPGQEWKIKSVSYDKDFAVYTLDLAGSDFGVEDGYLYFDSRDFDVLPIN